MKTISVVTQAEITGTAVTQFLNELEDQPLPFDWRCVSTRTLKLFLDGEETPVYIVLFDDGSWTLNACVEV